MLVYLVASLLVCLSELTGAQYYGSQSRPPQYSPQQQNSQAWRQWYYQRRQQQQQRENSSRGRPSTPIASPAANYYPSRYQQQQYSGNSQQYYQQGQYPQQQYSGYRQPGYGDYRQPNYQPPPPPMTPPPPVTPAEQASASSGKTSPNSVNESRPTIVSTAARVYPDLQNLAMYRNYYQGMSPAYRNPEISGQAALLQRQKMSSSGFGQSGGSNAKMALSPAFIKAVQVLARYYQYNASPGSGYQNFGSLPKSQIYDRRINTNPYSSLYKRATLRNMYPNGRMNPRLRQVMNARTAAINRARTVGDTTTGPTTTPGIPVTTEFEFEGPTTPTTRLPKRVYPPFQGGALSVNNPVIGQLPPLPQQSFSFNSPPQRSFSNHRPPQRSFSNRRPPEQSFSNQRPPQQPFSYESQPYQTANAVPPGFASMEAYRAEIMSAINLLTNDISSMTSSGSNAAANVQNTTPTNKMSQSTAVKSPRLSKLPGDLSFLLGKFASKLPPKSSPATKSGSQLAQLSKGAILPSSLSSSLSSSSSFQMAPQPQGPPSEWSGLFDMTPQQSQQLRQGTWTPSAPLQQPPVQEIPPPPTPATQLLEQTTPASPQQTIEPPPEFTVSPQLLPNKPPPPQDIIGPQSPPYQPPQDPYSRDPYQSPQQNRSYLYEPPPNINQPPLLDPGPQGAPNPPIEPQPLDLQWQPPQQPVPQQPPLNRPPPRNYDFPLQPHQQQQPLQSNQQQQQPPLDLQWPQPPPISHQRPLDIPPQPAGGPPCCGPQQPPHSRQPPEFSSFNNNRQYHHPPPLNEPPPFPQPQPQPPPYDFNQGPSNPTYEPPPMDMPPPGPQQWPPEQRQPPQPSPHPMSPHQPPLDIAPPFQQEPRQYSNPPPQDYYTGPPQFQPTRPAEPQFQEPQRPPPLDISNYRPPNSNIGPPPPQNEFAPPNPSPNFNSPPLEPNAWAPPRDFGGRNFETFSNPAMF